MQNLNRKRVLITGGAQGIGKEIALICAAEGAELILTDINQAKLDQTREEITKRFGKCWGYLLDVTDLESIPRVREQIHGDTGSIDVLVNNAGIVHGGSFVEVPLEMHLNTYKVNLFGLVAITHAFLPDLVHRGSSHLVNIASASGLIGLPFGSTYASSKWAVIGFSESIRLELKEQGHKHVGVTTVCPSYVSTGMFEGARPPIGTFLLNPKKLAQKIVTAMKKNEPFVLEPWLVKLMPIIKGLLPIPIADLLSDVTGATSSMTRWRGHGVH